MAAEPLPALASTTGNTAVVADATENVLRERLEGWRLAWASRDAEAYLAHYSPRFVAANGQTHGDWAVSRRRIISSRPEIVLHLSAIRWLALSPDRWQVQFLQDYAAGGHVEKQLPKTLELVLENGQWNIVSERTTGVETARP